MKLKKILSEAKVWERNFGEPLPVLELKFGSKAQYDAYKKHPELRKKNEKLSVPKAVKLANLVMKGR